VEGVEGNINTDEPLRRLYAKLLEIGGVEKVFLSRKEAGKNRLRTTSNSGREIMIDVARGTTIRHGDVLSSDENRMLVAEWLPEETMIIGIMPAQDQNFRAQTMLAIKLGYICGIKHLPLFVEGTEILIPVDEGSSKDDIARSFSNVQGINMRFEKRILEHEPIEVSGHEHHIH